MSSQTTTPRFDAFLTAAENRRDNWQRLHGLAQAWAAVAGDSRDPARAKMLEELRPLLTQLETLESYFAYPGPQLLQKLRGKLKSGDASSFADLARRIAKAV